MSQDTTPKKQAKTPRKRRTNGGAGGRPKRATVKDERAYVAALERAIRPDDLTKVWVKILEDALGEDRRIGLKAARMIVEYAIGKPKEIKESDDEKQNDLPHEVVIRVIGREDIEGTTTVAI